MYIHSLGFIQEWFCNDDKYKVGTSLCIKYANKINNTSVIKCLKYKNVCTNRVNS